MEVEDYLLHVAEKEREKLFKCYEKGRNGGISIDPWEDPTFEVYHKTDRYGFIHEKRLPQIPFNKNMENKNTTTVVDTMAVKSKRIQFEREKKWLAMLNRWEKKDTQKNLPRRVFKGIPNTMRSTVWKKLLNVDKSIAENPNTYRQMLELARLYSTEARQIDSDVNRQFRDHIYYRERYSIKQCSLFHVLTAYSMYNMELGYCQGMAGIAGMLLMYMGEEEAFWALNTFMIDKKYQMHGLYIDGFPKLTRLLYHHDSILEKYLPRLSKHLAKHNLDAVLYSVKWFFVIFVERVPFSLCLRIWDIYLLEGERICTAMAFTILRLHRKTLKIKDMDQMIDFFQCQLYKDFGFSDDYVIKTLKNSLDFLKQNQIDLPPPALDHEYPKQPLGKFIEPNINAKIGRRGSFTDKQRRTHDDLTLRKNSTINAGVSSSYCYSDKDDDANLNGSIRTFPSLNSLATSIATTTNIDTDDNNHINNVVDHDDDESSNNNSHHHHHRHHHHNNNTNNNNNNNINSSGSMSSENSFISVISSEFTRL